jgi:hypothetical protein
MVSRSPQEYMRRKGIVPTFTARPRFSPCELLVHKYDTGPSPLKSSLAEGDPPPDRVSLQPWTPLAEE